MAGAAACGAPGGPNPTDDERPPPATSSASAVGELEPAASQARRPNIVMVMLDDFSMDLVQTMRSMQQMRKAGASYPYSFVTDSLCCVSRSSFFTGQYPHQTGVRTNTSNQGTSAARRLARLRRQRQPRARRQPAAAGGRLHHRLRGQVPQRVRVGAGPRAAAGGSGLEHLQHGLRLGLRRLGLRQHLDRRRAAPADPAPRTAGQREQRREGPAYAGTVIGDLAMDFLTPGRGRGRALLPRGRVLRTSQPHQPPGALPRRPAVPADVPRPHRRAELRARRVQQAHRRRPARLRRPPPRQPAPAGRRSRSGAPGTPSAACAPPSRSATCATGPGWRSPPTGSIKRILAAVGPRHLRRAHLRQRLPPRSERPRSGQGDRRTTPTCACR